MPVPDPWYRAEFQLSRHQVLCVFFFAQLFMNQRGHHPLNQLSRDGRNLISIRFFWSFHQPDRSNFLFSQMMVQSLPSLSWVISTFWVPLPNYWLMHPIHLSYGRDLVFWLLGLVQRQHHPNWNLPISTNHVPGVSVLIISILWGLRYLKWRQFYSKFVL